MNTHDIQEKSQHRFSKRTDNRQNIKNSLKELASMQIKDDLMGLQNAFDQEAGQQPQNQQGSTLQAMKNMTILK